MPAQNLYVCYTIFSESIALLAQILCTTFRDTIPIAVQEQHVPYTIPERPLQYQLKYYTPHSGITLQ
jgi:hypothetical protein